MHQRLSWFEKQSLKIKNQKKKKKGWGVILSLLCSVNLKKVFIYSFFERVGV